MVNAGALLEKQFLAELKVEWKKRRTERESAEAFINY